ncbi:unnamed protein product, partial [Brenthis ino]
MVRNKTPRVCIIGAGIAGLASARYLKDEGINFKVFESTRYIGGTWRYDPRVGVDENGMPVHTSMYKHLRTNLPKATMELKGFPIPDEFPSFPSWKLYYDYVKDYARHFDLEQHIKFLHRVNLVTRKDNVWIVKYQNILSGDEFEEEFDFVIVGNGHHSKPHMPNIPGEELFKGSIIHSHDYREPDPYTDRRVLVIGAGPSGMDIAIDLVNLSKTLVHSYHSKINFKTPFPNNYIKKPDVKEFTEHGVRFVDGSYEDIDDVIYCTGYEFDYPFLDESCELNIAPHSVTPLHKYMVNIHHPSMMLMGLTVRACLVVALDAQSRYATALIKGNFTLPSKEEMLEEWQKHVDVIKSKGRPLSDIHFLGEKEDDYYAELTNESGIDRVPPVMFKIRSLDMVAKLENLYTYRNYVYKVIDNENFVRILPQKSDNGIN